MARHEKNEQGKNEGQVNYRGGYSEILNLITLLLDVL